MNQNSEHNHRILPEEDLRQVLTTWTAPDPSPDLEWRLFGRDPIDPHHRFWQWLRRGRVAVPVPVLAAGITILILVAALALRPSLDPPENRISPLQNPFSTHDTLANVVVTVEEGTPVDLMRFAPPSSMNVRILQRQTFDGETK